LKLATWPEAVQQKSATDADQTETSNGLTDSDATESYRRRFAQFGRNPRALDWRPGTQAVRYSAFAAGFSIAVPDSVLDIGCGLGDLLQFLREQGWTGEYQGIDLVPEFIADAERRFSSDPRASFKCLNFMDHPQNFSVDAVFCSGVLNYRRSSGHEAYVERFIAATIHSARRYLAIDFLSDTADRRRDDLFFHRADWILSLGLKHSRRVQLDHSYMPFEFMLKIWLPNQWPEGFPVF
jgi:SAM-dependent methyltransferase